MMNAFLRVFRSTLKKALSPAWGRNKIENGQEPEVDFLVAPWDDEIRLHVKSWLKYFAYIALIGILIGATGILISPGAGLADLRKLIFFIAMIFIGIWSAIGMIYFFFTPRRYSVNLKGIVINRPIRRVVIPFSEIRKVTLVNHVPFWWHFGLIGPADPFFGLVNAYVTRCTGLVRVDTVKRVCYLSPRDPAALVETVKQRLEQLHRSKN